MEDKYRICGLSPCGYCFPTKTSDRIICEYASAIQGAEKSEELFKGKECKYQLRKLSNAK